MDRSESNEKDAEDEYDDDEYDDDTTNDDYELNVGRVLRNTLSVWASSLVPFCLVGLLVYSPLLLTWRLPFGSNVGAIPIGNMGRAVLSVVLGFVLTGAVSWGVFERLHGQPVSSRTAVTAGFRCLRRIFLTSLLYSLYVGVGSLCLIIPGIVLMTKYWLAVPVSLLERREPSAALQRSAGLTTGNRWPILGLVLVSGVVSATASEAVGRVLPTARAAAGVWDIMGDPTALLRTLLMIPIQCFIAIVPVVAYHDLLIGREGADIEDLVKVFE